MSFLEVNISVMMVGRTGSCDRVSCAVSSVEVVIGCCCCEVCICIAAEVKYGNLYLHCMDNYQTRAIHRSASKIHPCSSHIQGEIPKVRMHKP